LGQDVVAQSGSLKGGIELNDSFDREREEIAEFDRLDGEEIGSRSLLHLLRHRHPPETKIQVLGCTSLIAKPKVQGHAPFDNPPLRSNEKKARQESVEDDQLA
jgi:hypothetical protein